MNSENLQSLFKENWNLLFALLAQCLPVLASVEDLLGSDLVNAKGDPIKTSSLKGKIIGLFFAEASNPSCKDFIPKLVAARDENRASFEVVYISSDENEESQLCFMKTSRMKWPATPFDPDKAKTLAKYFGVDRIPTLVILDGKGNHLTNLGRTAIANDPRKAIQEWRKTARSLKKPANP
jgi:thiol-disulfide isomerase/thioredoxin